MNRTAVLYGTLATLGFFVLAGVVTGLVPTGLFDRMVPRTPLDFAFLGITSLLAGAVVAQRTLVADCSGDACAIGGGATGFLAVACPHCNAILVALFSSSWLATYVDPLRPLFGILAVGLLGAVLYVNR